MLVHCSVQMLAQGIVEIGAEQQVEEWGIIHVVKALTIPLQINEDDYIQPEPETVAYGTSKASSHLALTDAWQYHRA